MDSDQNIDQGNVLNDAYKMVAEFQKQINAKRDELEMAQKMAYEELQQIRKEKAQWEAEKTRIKEIQDQNQQEVFQLNFRGDKAGFLLTKKLLCSVPGSMMEAMFSGRHEIPMKDGEVYFDRDPQVFRKVIWMIENKLTPKFDSEAEREITHNSTRSLKVLNRFTKTCLKNTVILIF